MATTTLGKVAVTPKGAWSNSTAYEVLDIVTNSGSAYMAKQAVQAGTALSNTSYWILLVEKGDKGDTGEITGASASISGGYGTPGVSVTAGGTSIERSFSFAFSNLVGNGIASITMEKTSTVGNVDTYTLTVTTDDGNSEALEIEVTNGAVTSVNGRTGAVTGLAEAQDKADIIISNAAGAIASFPDGAPYPVKQFVVNINPTQGGSEDPSPTNIRPIYGLDGAHIHRAGRNLIDGLSAFQTLKPAYGGSIITINTASKTAYCNFASSSRYLGLMFLGRNATEQTINANYFPFKANTQYTFIFKAESTAVALNIAVAFTDGTNTNSFNMSQRNADGYIVYTSPADKSVRSLYVGRYEGVSTFYYETFGVYEGIVTYEEHIAQTAKRISIDWLSVAGTVYGGTLTSHEDGTGTLVVDRRMSLFTGASGEGWSYSHSNTYNRDRVFAPLSGADISAGSMLQSNYVAYATNDVGSYPNEWGAIIASSGNIIIGVPSTINSANAWETYLSNNNLQVCYYLAAPLTYTLTAEQMGGILSTLYGENNVWSETGEISVDYRADTKLYIQQLTQPTDEDMIANANIDSGKFFMVGNTLFYSTAAIASGATIVPGTNCTQLSLADALNNLNA